MHESATDNLAAAWEELGPELSRLVRALGIGSANANDILQDVYITAREKCPPALDFKELRKWLIRVTVNRCRLEHRRTGCWRRAFLALTRLFDHRAQKASSAESLSHDEERNQVRQALQSLDADTRTILVLRYFAEFDSGEIGRMMNLPESTIRGRLRKARHKLADRLRIAGYSHEE
ncbi:MAG: sigma-70 family RNA polymerase sigma factor [Thermoguttaceae bacterium]